MEIIDKVRTKLESARIDAENAQEEFQAAVAAGVNVFRMFDGCSSLLKRCGTAGATWSLLQRCDTQMRLSWTPETPEADVRKWVQEWANSWLEILTGGEFARSSTAEVVNIAAEWRALSAGVLYRWAMRLLEV